MTSLPSSLTPPEGDGPAANRLRVLCQGILQTIHNADAAGDATLLPWRHIVQAEAERALVPRLEEGLRQLTETLGREVTAWLRTVQDLERLTDDDDRRADARELSKAPAWLESGNVCLDRGELEEAIAHAIPAALRLDPGLSVAYVNRAQAFARQHAWREALADAGMALRLDSGLAEAYFLRGTAASRLEDYLPAVADFTRLLELQPASYAAYNERGLVLLRLGMLQACPGRFRRRSDCNLRSAADDAPLQRIIGRWPCPWTGSTTRPWRRLTN